MEIVVYKDNHAYPAYVFEYTCPTLATMDPYRGDVLDMKTTTRYRRGSMPSWLAARALRLGA